MPREDQPATPPGGGGMRGPRPPTSNPRTGAPPRRRPRPEPQPASQGRGPQPSSPRPSQESSAEHYWDEALDHLRPSRAWTAFKKASALTRWIVLIFVVGLGAAAIVAIVLAGLFTLVDSSV